MQPAIKFSKLEAVWTWSGQPREWAKTPGEWKTTLGSGKAAAANRCGMLGLLFRSQSGKETLRKMWPHYYPFTSFELPPWKQLSLYVVYREVCSGSEGHTHIILCPHYVVCKMQTEGYQHQNSKHKIILLSIITSFKCFLMLLVCLQQQANIIKDDNTPLTIFFYS